MSDDLPSDPAASARPSLPTARQQQLAVIIGAFEQMTPHLKIHLSSDEPFELLRVFIDLHINLVNAVNTLGVSREDFFRMVNERVAQLTLKTGGQPLMMVPNYKGRGRKDA